MASFIKIIADRLKTSVEDRSSRTLFNSSSAYQYLVSPRVGTTELPTSVMMQLCVLVKW